MTDITNVETETVSTLETVEPMTITEIADRVGCSRVTVYSRIKSLGLSLTDIQTDDGKPGKDHPLTVEAVNAILATFKPNTQRETATAKGALTAQLNELQIKCEEQERLIAVLQDQLDRANTQIDRDNEIIQSLLKVQK